MSLIHLVFSLTAVFGPPCSALTADSSTAGEDPANSRGRDNTSKRGLLEPERDGKSEGSVGLFKIPVIRDGNLGQFCVRLVVMLCICCQTNLTIRALALSL